MTREHPSVKLGRYRHYKGREYSVLGVARHSESEEELVVYRPEYGERGLWVRELRMFCEDVTVNGHRVPRFRYLGPLPAGADDIPAADTAEQSMLSTTSTFPVGSIDPPRPAS
jgi:hypothetical protein